MNRDLFYMPHIIHYIICSTVFVLFSLTTLADDKNTLDSLLSVYDHEIQLNETYLKERQTVIDSIKKHGNMNDVETLLSIGKLYVPYQCDSAILYLNKASECQPQPSIEAKLHLIYLLASIGFYNEGFIETQHLGTIPDSLKVFYFNAMNRLYSESAVYGKSQQIKAEYFKIADCFRDSLFYTLRHKQFKLSGVNKYDWHENMGFEYYRLLIIQARSERKYDKAIAYADTIFSYLTLDEHIYAIMAYEHSVTLEEMGDYFGRMCWLTRSAIADVRSGVTDNGSSWTLASTMFHQGSLDRALLYINYSVNNAGVFNAQLRHLQISPLGNLINQSYSHKMKTMSEHLAWAVGGLICLLIVILLLFAFNIQQVKKLNHMNKKQKELNEQLSALNMELTALNKSLKESNHVKELFICQYLEVYSEYIRRMSKLARKAGMKDAEELMKNEMAQFYNRFDNTFLSIYPKFIEEFNALLKQEEQIIPKSDELLTTELRIFALIRLGISSSVKIAELLCYSVNTIYNYRAKVKNSSLGDRENFEERVKELCQDY